MKIAAVYRLMRLENCAMAGIAVAVGYVVAGGLEPSYGLLLALASAFLITGGGNAVNDYYDRGVDRRNAPHRPIPSGDIGADATLRLAGGLFAAGAGMALLINLPCLALAGFNSVVLFFYARNLKASAFLGNVAVSYLTGSTFVYGALVLLNPLTTVFLALLAFLANVGREIIGDVEDVEGDGKAGMKTLAVRLGREKGWWYGRAYIAAAMLLSPVPYLTGLLGVYYLVPVLAADALFAASLLTGSARLNQRLTKLAILLGLVAFMAGAVL